MLLLVVNSISLSSAFSNVALLSRRKGLKLQMSSLSSRPAVPSIEPSKGSQVVELNSGSLLSSVKDKAKKWAKLFKSAVLALVFMFGSTGVFLGSPSISHAAIEGKSHIDAMLIKKRQSQNKAGKKLLMIEAEMSHILHETFNKWDPEGTGAISREDLRSALLYLEEEKYIERLMTMEEMDAFLVEMDTDCDGKIQFDEFKNAVEVVETSEGGWHKVTRADIMKHEVHEYGEKWKGKHQSGVHSLFQTMEVLSGFFSVLVIIILPIYFVFPWELFKVTGASSRSSKGQWLKRRRIAGKQAEFWTG
eukprot:749773-Hanusia_phi.AAC.7